MRVVLSAGRVLLGPRGEVLHDGAVLLDGPRIAAVGSRAELATLAPDAARVDHPDGTLLPGLIDAHVQTWPSCPVPASPTRSTAWGTTSCGRG